MHHMRDMDTKSQTDDAILAEITQGCLLTRTRRLSRLVTNTYDQALKSFGVNAPQFSLLVLISKFGPASRAEIGRVNYQDRSTLTRNLALLLAEGWVRETPTEGGRSRPIEISTKGRQLLALAAPAWRDAQAEVRTLIGEEAAAKIVSVVDAISLDQVRD
jgi:DNA-binding MarR family transcriptional regulator